MKIIQPQRKSKNGSDISEALTSDSSKSRQLFDPQNSKETSKEHPRNFKAKAFQAQRDADVMDPSATKEIYGSADPSDCEFELAPGKKRRKSELQDRSGANTGQLDLSEIDPVKKEFNKILQRGISLLAIREHSVQELEHKLSSGADEPLLIDQVMEFLIENDYVSDQRFTEAFVRSKQNKGQGPIKIRAQLKAKGVSSIMVDDTLAQSDAKWFDFAQMEYQKKYRDAPVKDYNDWSKRARFLQGRGFTMDHIHCAVPQPSAD